MQIRSHSEDLSVEQRDSNKKNTEQTENRVLKPSLALYGTVGSTFFSDRLLWSFLFHTRSCLERHLFRWD